MSRWTLLYAFGLALLAAFVWMPRAPAPTVVIQHDTVALRIDTVRQMERAGGATCALPAVVVDVFDPSHGSDGVVHGHYAVAAAQEALKVTALPPNAHVGEVVCVLRNY